MQSNHYLVQDDSGALTFFKFGKEELMMDFITSRLGELGEADKMLAQKILEGDRSALNNVYRAKNWMGKVDKLVFIYLAIHQKNPEPYFEAYDLD